VRRLGALSATRRSYSVRISHAHRYSLACSVFLGQIFTKKELAAGLVALVGVVFIAHPKSIFGRVGGDATTNKAEPIGNVTTTQRLIAILVSLTGVVGQSGSYTMIRVIGNRGHALISVNYFAVLGTVGSTIALLVIPGIGFTMPQGTREWILLTLLGVMGFVLQFLLTAGLQLDKSSKATSMLYTGVLFALSFDWAIWGVLPGKWSLFGGSIIIGSTLWSALQKPMDHLQTLRKRLQMRKVLFLVLKQRMETE
jgi:drug/metabolite transporter (DMT)-like permease